jgi:chromosome segregation ATPase
VEATQSAVHRADLAEAGRVELQRQNGQLTEFLQRAQAEAAQTGQTVAELRAKLEAADQRATEANRRVDNAEQTADKVRKEAENARIAEQAAQARLEAAAREIEALRDQLKTERGAASKAMENAAVLQGRLEVLERQRVSVL